MIQDKFVLLSGLALWFYTIGSSLVTGELLVAAMTFMWGINGVLLHSTYVSYKKGDGNE